MIGNTTGPMPAYDAIVPADIQTFSIIFSAIVLLAALIWAFVLAQRHRTAMPFLLLLAGFCTVPLESVVCKLGHAWHTAVGQIPLYIANDRSVPLYFGLIYSWYFGGVYIAALPRIVAQNYRRGDVWKLYFATCALVYGIEPFFIYHGMWSYYGNQPLWIWKGGQPLFWTFVNSTCIFVPLALLKLFYPLLRGWKQLLVLIISPIGAFAGHVGAGFPWYLVANSALESNPLWVQLSGIASVSLALAIAAGCCEILVSGTLTATASAGPVDSSETATKRRPIRA